VLSILLGTVLKYWQKKWLFREQQITDAGGIIPGQLWKKTDSTLPGQLNRRLHSLVNHAHKLGLWIRFYTLNGHERNESLDWSDSYNFGSEERVKIRWRVAIEAGVDFVATDQYELFAKYLDTEKFTVTR